MEVIDKHCRDSQVKEKLTWNLPIRPNVLPGMEVSNHPEGQCQAHQRYLSI